MSIPGDGDVADVENDSRKKLRWEIRKLKLDWALAVLGLVFIVTFSIGAFLLFLYFWRYSFNAGGISASDTVSFSLLLFGFSVTVSIALVYATIAAYPLTRTGHFLLVKMQEGRNRWRLPRRGTTPAGEVKLLIGNPMRQVWRESMTQDLWIGCFLLVFVVLGFVFANAGVRYFLGSMLAVGMWLSIFVFGTQVSTYSKWPKVKRTANPFDAWLDRQPFAIRQMVIASIFTVFMLAMQLSWIQDTSMLTIGFRKHDVSVRLSKEDFNAMADQAIRAGHVLQACAPLDPRMPVLDHMDVLWYGLGTRALIRYPALPLGASEATERTTVRFEPLNASITVMSSRPERDTCREFLLTSIFRRGQATFVPGAESALEGQLGWLENDRQRWYVSIALFDPGAPTGETMVQAEAIKAYLGRRYRLPPASIFIETGRVDLKRDCGDFRDVALCNKANRRVEVRGELAL